MLPYTKKMLAIVGQNTLPTDFKLSSPSKISKKSKNAFSLPAGSDFSCVGETDVCRDACYAKKGRHVFSTVQNLQAGNWALIKDFEASNSTDLAAAAFLRVIPEKAKLMRIHESGDFHSQWYIGVWAKIAEKRPDTNFWFYTRCFQFDFSALSKLPNVASWASTDSSNEELAKAFVKDNPDFKHAWGPLEVGDLPINTVLCPVTTGKLDVNGACETCRLCVDKGKIKKNIGFVEH